MTRVLIAFALDLVVFGIATFVFIQSGRMYAALARIDGFSKGPNGPAPRWFFIVVTTAAFVGAVLMGCAMYQVALYGLGNSSSFITVGFGLTFFAFVLWLLMLNNVRYILRVHAATEPTFLP